MYRPCIPLVCGLLLVITLPSGSSAQEFGRGRLLKRLRDELMGRRDDDDKKQKEKSQKQPTPAKPNANSRYQPPSQYRNRSNQPVGSGYRGSNSNRTPSPTNNSNSRNSNRRQPTPRVNTPRDSAARAERPTPAQISQQARDAANSSRNSYSRDNSAYRRPTPPSPQPESRSANRGQGSGFGMSVKEKGDSVIVSRIVPNGNAAEAGLRTGDQIVELGGLEIQNAQDFDEFAKILGQGDQMEFKIRSRGKKKTVMVTYGQAPPPSAVESPGEAPGFTPGRSASNRSRSVLENIGDSQDSNEVRSLKRTIETQRQEISTLREELVRLRQQVLARDRNR